MVRVACRSDIVKAVCGLKDTHPSFLLPVFISSACALLSPPAVWSRPHSHYFELEYPGDVPLQFSPFSGEWHREMKGEKISDSVTGYSQPPSLDA